MSNVSTRDLKDFDVKEKAKAASKKAKPVLSKDLTNADIDKARKQGEKDGKRTEQPDSE